MLLVANTKRYSAVEVAREGDLAAKSVQSLFKIFQARKLFAVKAKARREEDLRNNVQAPFVPTPMAAVEMFAQAFVRDGDVVLDLGCGDGRVLLEAARARDIALGVGVDIQSHLVLKAAAAATSAASKLVWICDDFFAPQVCERLPQVTVCFLFLLPSLLEAIACYLVQHLPVNARVCLFTFDFAFAWWRPRQTVTVPGLEHACTMWEYVVTPDVKSEFATRGHKNEPISHRVA